MCGVRAWAVITGRSPTALSLCAPLLSGTVTRPALLNTSLAHDVSMRLSYHQLVFESIDEVSPTFLYKFKSDFCFKTKYCDNLQFVFVQIISNQDFDTKEYVRLFVTHFKA